MREVPILFSSEMVQANLAGRKNQTRRMKGLEKINEKPGSFHLSTIYHKDNNVPKDLFTSKSFFEFWEDEAPFRTIRITPSIQPGDVMWVRETHYALGYFRYVDGKWTTKTNRRKTEFVDVSIAKEGVYRYEYDELFLKYEYRPPKDKTVYAANTEVNEVKNLYWVKRPCLFMPRQASRITLKCTGVRCERLKSISEQDAKNEGVRSTPGGSYYDYIKFGVPVAIPGLNATDSFFSLWQSINGIDSLNNNPWVFIYDYEIIATPNTK